MSSVVLDKSERLFVEALRFENVASPYINDLVEKEEIAAQFLENLCIQEHKRAENWLYGKYKHRSKEWMYWLSAGSNPLDVKLKTGNGLLIPRIVASDCVTYEEAIRKIIRGCDFWQLGNYLGEKPSGRPDGVLRRGVSRGCKIFCVNGQLSIIDPTRRRHDRTQATSSRPDRRPPGGLQEA